MGKNDLLKIWMIILLLSILPYSCTKSYVRPFSYQANQEAVIQYQKALLFKEQKKYELAILEFRRYLDLYGDIYYADEALYHMAECLRGIEQFNEALQTYKSIIKRYKDSSYVPASWYGMGECYKINNEWKNSVEIFLQVVKKYSQTLWCERSIKQIEEITKMFPESKYFKKTQKKVDKLVKKLKKK